MSLLTLILLQQIIFLPFGGISELRFKNPDETAFMREDEELASGRGTIFLKHQVWVPLSKIPRHAIDAVIVAEDGTFWSHSGFDWFEFREAIEKNVSETRAARGASTITQQLVKNLYLSSWKSPFRKIKEWILTWYMERTLTKDRILELYLNFIEWGNGVYGVEAAARYYFGKSASELTEEESIRLAAIIPSPKTHRADDSSSYVLRRSQIILRRMKARGMGGEQPDPVFLQPDSIENERGDSP